MKEFSGRRSVAPSPSPFGGGLGWGSSRIALRNLRHNGFYSVINIVGLAVSLTICIMIMLWIHDEMSYDAFYKKEKQLYQTIVTFNMNNEDLYWKTSSPLMASQAKAEIPGIEDISRVQFGAGGVLKYHDKQTSSLAGIMVDSSFFKMFGFPILEGDARALFMNRNSVILSQTTAKVLFGDESAIGKAVVSQSGGQEYHVAAVIKDMPSNTVFRSDVIFNYEILYQLVGKSYFGWGNLASNTFMLLNPSVDPAQVAKSLSEISNRNMEGFIMTYLLQPLADDHFYDAKGTPTSNLQACRLFSVMVLVLLSIACINYVNLVTARTSRTWKELFVRRMLGAKKINLFLNSMSESALLFVMSLVLATVLLVVFFPFFREISGKDTTFGLFSADTLAMYGITFVAVMILGGIYPAIRLAKTNTGKNGISGKHTKEIFFRRSLVVLQFVSAVVLISGSIIFNKQMQFIRQKDIGYNKDNILQMPVPTNILAHYEAFKSDLLQQPGITGITSSSQNLLNAEAATGWIDKDDKRVMLVNMHVDHDFIPVMDMELVQGENFSGSPADQACFILNETALRQTGIENPVGNPFTFAGVEGTIIGIVKDFNFRSLHMPVGPIILRSPAEQNVLYVRMAPGASQQVLATIEKYWKQYAPEAAFEYYFLDDSFDKLYKSDLRITLLFNLFAFIAILVSCLGLFGLVTYTAETKTKEIGIRKVLGASIAGIVEMLSKEFLILVGIAMLIAFPLAYYWLDKMLQDYAYRINISWWMFALAGIITVVLTLLTVGWKAIRAATANPVKAIKSE